MPLFLTNSVNVWRNVSCFCRTSLPGSGMTTSMRSRPCGTKEISRTPVGLTRCFSTSITCLRTNSGCASAGIFTEYTRLTPPRKSLPRRRDLFRGHTLQISDNVSTRTKVTCSASRFIQTLSQNFSERCIQLFKLFATVAKRKPN